MRNITDNTTTKKAGSKYETIAHKSKPAKHLSEKSKTKIETFSFDEKSFKLNGKSFFVLSGEMHYFRIDADLWPKHLQRMKDAGLNTVSSYIPWSLHEQVEDHIDLEGKYGPNLNLKRFIELCKEFGLKLILKPGPYILAELLMHGIPPWLIGKYPEVLAVQENGKPFGDKFTSLNHPTYRQKVLNWYDSIMSLMARYQISQGGPIILMQVCNEVGLFQWLCGKGDYSDASVGAYREYLESTYGDIDKLNAKYGSDYSKWEEVAPPAGQVESQADQLNYHDWHGFHRNFYCEYIKWLIDHIKSRGVRVPLFHNVPGWVFGRAKHMPVCLSMYDELSQLYPDLLLGVDHIPENVSYRNFHDDRLINEYTKAAHGGKGPLYVAELQAGTREANVRIYPKEMELFYKACLANGIVSMNYYMYCQGQNPPGWEIYDSSFYLQTPLDVNGEPGESYPVTERISKLVKTHGERICQSSTIAKQAIAYYPPNYYREFSRPLFTGENFSDMSKIGGRIDPKMLTEDMLFDGLAKMLAMDNQEFDFFDLSSISANELKKYEQLWIATTEQMDAKAQMTLLEYVEQGGHLICFPTVPTMDFHGQACRILADGLGVETDEILEGFDGMIEWSDSKELIHAMSYGETFKAENGDVIARTLDGKPCGVVVPRGKGSATVFGTGFIYQAIAHKHAWQKLGLKNNYSGNVTCDNSMVITRARMHDDGGGYLFLLNYHNQELETKASINGQGLPLEGTFHLPATSGLMLPFNLPLTDDCKLVWGTSEVSEIEASDECIKLTVNGHEKTPGQLRIESKRIIAGVEVDGKEVDFVQESDTIQVAYEHKDGGCVVMVRFG